MAGGLGARNEGMTDSLALGVMREWTTLYGISIEMGGHDPSFPTRSSHQSKDGASEHLPHVWSVLQCHDY